MTFKEVAHFYIGCQLMTPYGEGKFLFSKNGYDPGTYNPVVIDRGDNHFAFQWNEVTPILRHISQMTHEEGSALYTLIFKRKFASNGQKFHFDEKEGTPERWCYASGLERLIYYADGNVTADSDLHFYNHNQHAITLYLTSIGIDLFNLIKNGHAINAKQP